MFWFLCAMEKRIFLWVWLTAHPSERVSRLETVIEVTPTVHYHFQGFSYLQRLTISTYPFQWSSIIPAIPIHGCQRAGQISFPKAQPQSARCAGKFFFHYCRRQKASELHYQTGCRVRLGWFSFIAFSPFAFNQFFRRFLLIVIGNKCV